MREGWKEVKFGEVVEFPPKIKMVKGNKYPFIPMELIDGGYKYVKPIEEKELAGGGAKFEEGDTLFARITPCLQNGKIAQAKNLNNKPGFGSTEYFIFRGIPNVTDNDYVYYLSQMQEFRDNAINSMVGASGRQRADAGHVKSFVFNLPPLDTQKNIASILSGYDDLIENNLKRIKILEEMAQQTYEEWFVRMRYPGHDASRASASVNPETGLPEGWEKVKMKDKIEVGRGSSPRPISDKKYFDGGSIPWLKIADATSSKIFIYETKEYVNEYGASFSRKLPIGSIVVAASGTLGFPMFLGVEACIHDGWLYFKGIKDEFKEYFYFTFYSLRTYFESISYGAAIQNINTSIVREAPLLVPDNTTLKDFKNIVGKIFTSIDNLQNQNQRLREARDLLLPRLMMGMIEV